MRTQPETRARSSQEAGKRALNLRGSKANQACISRLGIFPWIEYVGTDDNIADLPSRGEFELLRWLGGPNSYRPAVFPPRSAFTGLLQPLNGLGISTTVV